MPKWHIYENSDELVIKKTRNAKVMVTVPFNYDFDYTGQDGVKVEYTRRRRLAERIAKALSEKDEP
jgi:hypothetical protein